MCRAGESRPPRAHACPRETCRRGRLQPALENCRQGPALASPTRAACNHCGITLYAAFPSPSPVVRLQRVPSIFPDVLHTRAGTPLRTRRECPYRAVADTSYWCLSRVHANCVLLHAGSPPLAVGGRPTRGRLEGVRLAGQTILWLPFQTRDGTAPVATVSVRARVARGRNHSRGSPLHHRESDACWADERRRGVSVLGVRGVRREELIDYVQQGERAG